GKRWRARPAFTRIDDQGGSVMLSRRRLLQGAALLPLAATVPWREAQGQVAGATSSIPPIVFVHGDGDHAGVWITTLWRMESNGVPRDRLLPISFTDPRARSDDSVPQPGRSSTEDQRRELAEAIAMMRRRTSAARV